MPLCLPEEKALRFRSGDIELDARFSAPRGDIRRACVVCHPHPLYGGDMENNIVVAVTAALAAKGIPALRFNFRGVGASGGTHGGGEPEVGDALAAAAALQAETGISRIALIGYSFGAVVALRAFARNPEDFPARLDAVAAIAPPLAMFDASFVSELTGSLLFVAGDRDQYCPRDRFEKLEGPGIEPDIVCGGMNETERVLLKGADHFLGGFEERLGTIVADWAKDLGTFP